MWIRMTKLIKQKTKSKSEQNPKLKANWPLLDNNYFNSDDIVILVVYVDDLAIIGSKWNLIYALLLAWLIQAFYIIS